MLQEIIDLQTNAVNNIILQIPHKNEITFKSPTGSGKTYMMGDLMNKIIMNDNDVIFLVSSLSKGSLAEQNYNKFIEYASCRKFEYIKPYLISSESFSESRLFIPTDHNVYVLPRDLYKNKSKLKQGALLDFLYTMTTKSPLGKDKKIYLIKDECHIATTKLDSLSKDYFSKIFNFSATPKMSRGQKPDVEIKEIDAINAKLIKRVSYEDENESLECALSKYKEIRTQYNDLLGINPCMIIQISNKDKAENELNEIFNILGSTEYQDLKWMLIVDKDKDCDTNDVFKTKNIPVSKWKDYAKTNTATIDIIIFKMVITEGWDIPRACMLYQVRNSQSKQLDEQVIGRVRRNPRLLDFETLPPNAKDIATKAYVWGIVPKESKNIREVHLAGNDNKNEIQNEIKLKITRLKRPVESTTFNVESYLTTKLEKTLPTSIFDLHKKYVNSTNEVKEMCSDYVNSISKWFKFVENIDEISVESRNILCNYENSMEIVQDDNYNDLNVSFPLISYYTENGNFKSISNWIWQRTDDGENFSFDSEAEKEWADILLSLVSEDALNRKGRVVKGASITTIVENEEISSQKYMVGKNYLSNSQIKYEYYLKGIRSSYPDFIMKDYLDRIHIFETKSLNKSNTMDIDSEEYEDKIKALKECYKYASRLTGYYFYIPIKKGNDWTIFVMHSGEEYTLSKRRFIDLIKNKANL